MRSVLAGPQSITAEELAKVESPASLSNPWVSVTAAVSRDTLVRLESSKGEEVAVVLVKLTKDQWLPTEVPDRHPGNTYTGYLMEFNPSWAKEKRESVEKSVPIKGKLLAFELNAARDYKGECYKMLGIVGGLALLGLLMGVTGAVGLVRLRRPAVAAVTVPATPPPATVAPQAPSDPGAITTSNPTGPDHSLTRKELP